LGHRGLWLSRHRRAKLRDIFYNNCFKNGNSSAELTEAQIEDSSAATQSEKGYALSVDLPNQTVSDNYGLVYKFEIEPSRTGSFAQGSRRHRHSPCSKSPHRHLRKIPRRPPP